MRDQTKGGASYREMAEFLRNAALTRTAVSRRTADIRLLNIYDLLCLRDTPRRMTFRAPSRARDPQIEGGAAGVQWRTDPDTSRSHRKFSWPARDTVSAVLAVLFA